MAKGERMSKIEEIRNEVWVTGADEVITRTNCVHRLEDEIFTGALWQRRTVPRDPFAKGGGG